MYYVDRFLQKARINKTKKYITNGSKVLDIGAHKGELFDYFLNQGITITGIGIEPLNNEPIIHKQYKIINDFFPTEKLNENDFDVATLLAVLEHLPLEIIPNFAEQINNALKKGGYLIITVPSPSVDYILNVLSFFRLIKGMSLEQHYGYDITMTKGLFEKQGFTLVKHKKFQLGLNNLFVFKKN